MKIDLREFRFFFDKNASSLEDAKQNHLGFFCQGSSQRDPVFWKVFPVCLNVEAVFIESAPFEDRFAYFLFTSIFSTKMRVLY